MWKLRLTCSEPRSSRVPNRVAARQSLYTRRQTGKAKFCKPRDKFRFFPRIIIIWMQRGVGLHRKYKNHLSSTIRNKNTFIQPRQERFLINWRCSPLNRDIMGSLNAGVDCGNINLTLFRYSTFSLLCMLHIMLNNSSWGGQGETLRQQLASHSELYCAQVLLT